jgi:hypothetical protein
MRTGTARSAGSAGMSRASAAGPPVDTPMATISDRFRGASAVKAKVFSRCVSVLWGGMDRFLGMAVRGRPFRMDRISILLENERNKGARSVSSFRLFSVMVFSLGLRTKSNAPASRLAIIRRPPRPASALSIRIPTCGYRDCSRASTSSPSMPGISISSVTRSGFKDVTLSSAVFPSRAVPTTSIPGMPPMTSDIIIRNTMESSTTSMRRF